jgi:hypothetical protein
MKYLTNNTKPNNNITYGGNVLIIFCRCFIVLSFSQNPLMVIYYKPSLP